MDLLIASDIITITPSHHIKQAEQMQKQSVSSDGRLLPALAFFSDTLPACDPSLHNRNRYVPTNPQWQMNSVVTHKRLTGLKYSAEYSRNSNNNSILNIKYTPLQKSAKY